jgi:hypothetical protein
MRRKIGRAGGALLFAWFAANVAAATTTVTIDTGKLRGEARVALWPTTPSWIRSPPSSGFAAISPRSAVTPAMSRSAGESAGGMSVHILMTSAAASGLFQKAIVQSGGGRANLLRGRPLAGGADSAEAIGVVFAQQAGIEGTGSEALRQLRALPAEALLNGLNMASMGAAGVAGV